MVRDSKVFLLDEPLSNLDAKLRTSMRSEITKLHKRLQTPFVYVTHDQTEAMTMADRIVVMKGGVIQQVDTPQALYENPCNLFVAGFIGLPQMNFFPGMLQKSADGYSVQIDDCSIAILPERLPHALAERYVGRQVVLGIRPEAFQTSAVNPDAMLEGIVDVSELMGAEKYLYCKMGEHKFIASVPGKHPAKPDSVVQFSLELSAVHLFDAESQNRITNDRID